jgi:tetratricopeptide (TPR) repeat protein
MSNPTQPQSFNYPTFKSTMRPEKQAVANALNAYEANRKTPHLLPELGRQMLERLEEFKEVFPAGFPDRQWHILIMEGLVAGALGQFDKGIEVDLKSLRHANSPEQQSISYLNVSEKYRYSGRPEESLDAAVKAYRLNPRHKGLVCNLVLALEAAGRRDEAKHLLAVIQSGKHDPADLFAAYAKHSDEMKQLLGLTSES